MQIFGLFLSWRCSVKDSTLLWELGIGCLSKGTHSTLFTLIIWALSAQRCNHRERGFVLAGVCRYTHVLIFGIVWPVTLTGYESIDSEGGATAKQERAAARKAAAEKKAAAEAEK